MRFNVKDYEMVQDRIVRFHKTYPNGAIINEVIEISADGKRVLVKCSIYKDIKDSIPAGVDIAMDWQSKGSGRGAESTNWVETSSTSATGRALSLVIGFKGKGRASAEEMMIAQERILQERDVSEFYDKVEEETEPKPEPKKEVKKKTKKSIKEEVKETQKKPDGMSGEDAKKQELWLHIQEFASEWEKNMVELNPEINPDKDRRMKFKKIVLSNMEKCLGTLGWKKYEAKWNQWVSIHNSFKPEKLDVIPEEKDLSVEDALGEMGIEGVITEGDFPPVDASEEFSDFPPLNRNIEFKYRVKDISEKQIGFIKSLADKRGIDEQKLRAWILHQFKKTFKALDTKEASMIINCLQ